MNGNLLYILSMARESLLECRAELLDQSIEHTSKLGISLSDEEYLKIHQKAKRNLDISGLAAQVIFLIDNELKGQGYDPAGD